MAKLTIFLCLLVAGACVIPTHASIIGKTVGNVINQANTNVLKLSNDIINNFRKVIDPIVETAIDTLDKIKKNGEDIVEDVSLKIKETFLGMEERINELTERIPNDVDVTECKNMAEGIKETGMMILENANSCVTQKIDRADMLIENMKALAINSTKACDDVIKKSIECTNNSNVPLKIIECMGPTMQCSVINLTTKTTQATVDITKLASYITTFLPSLALCSSIGTIATLINNADAIVSSVEACINERLNAYYENQA